MVMNPDGSGLEVYVTGIRNSVGFDWDPRTQELWFTDNGRDWLGVELNPAYAAIAQERLAAERSEVRDQVAFYREQQLLKE